MATGTILRPIDEKLLNTPIQAFGLSAGEKCTLTMASGQCVIYGMRRPNVKIAKFYEHWNSTVWNFGANEPSDGPLTFTKNTNSDVIVITNPTTSSRVLFVVIGATAVIESIS